ncbi:MAG: hypothetical protein GC189_11945 [Alphaproteobacteria bacterium]|nr:hypothetical protein [Alphaproteobacteria bacterium]
MTFDDIFEGDADTQRKNIARASAQSPTFLSGSVQERLSSLPAAAQAVQQAHRAAFDAALSALLEEGYAPRKKLVGLARGGDLEALSRIADDARRFHLDQGLDAPPEIMAASDVLGALAVFLTVDREQQTWRPETYNEWMGRRDAALYALSTAEATFQQVTLGVFNLAGERLEGKSRSKAAGAKSGAARRKQSLRDQARADFKISQGTNRHLTVSSFAELRASEYGRDPRTVKGWLKGM